ncbi:MAG: hypothetical protein D6768_05905 [Chloroflexi bacterium]|nr:MAG: hypothetical protein D6768_05905 [Chloroflexota bacterium]
MHLLGVQSFSQKKIIAPSEFQRHATSDARKKADRSKKMGPLVAASLALFIVVVDSTMMKFDPAQRVSAAESARAS